MPGSRSEIVGDAIAAYLADHTSPTPAIDLELMAVTQERTGRAAGMQIGHDQGLFFEMLARSMGVRTAIEIGTFTGYSALNTARGLAAGGTLYCCDVSEEWTSIAREFWERAGVADRIVLTLGPALDTIAAFPAELRFDLAFIDADKSNYPNYYEALLPRMNPNGLILVDNTLWSGRVTEPPRDDDSADTVAMRAFNRQVANDPRVRSAILPIGDGVTMIQPR